MTIETTKWDIQDHLKSPERIAGYLEAVLEDGDPDLIAAAIGDVARARGITELARETGVSREALYKAFKGGGNPRMSTLLAVMKAFGVRLAVTPVS